MNRRGRQRELDVVVLLTENDFVAYRLAHGCADVVALRHDLQPQLIQVKSTAGGPYERFGPHERAALMLEAEQAGAAAVLAWWPPRQAVPRWIDSADWPALRMAA
jgi:Holliday junction resolvase